MFGTKKKRKKGKKKEKDEGRKKIFSKVINDIKRTKWKFWN